MKSPSSVRVGEKYPTKCGDLVVEKYVSALEVVVKFVDTGFRTVTNAGNIRKGSVKDPCVPSVFGVGFLGLGKHKANSRRVRSSAYTCWHNMIKRCYCKKYQEKQPWYSGCSVDPSWHNFQNFADWYYDNFVEGFELDKDIRTLGNKVYSPAFCQFVPPQANRIHKSSYVLRTRSKK